MPFDCYTFGFGYSVAKCSYGASVAISVHSGLAQAAGEGPDVVDQ